MRAIAIQSFGGPEKLQLTDLPRPRPDKGEVLIRVVSAGVNPMDCQVREGRLENLFSHRFPLIPGWDAAGVVEEFGEGVGRFRKGDRVWALARKRSVQWGCYAEYVSVPESGVALMPAKLLFEEAAAVPLAALTAMQSLFRRGSLGQDSEVLVHGAGGGVGHFAVQLAKDAGARVVGTGSADSQSFILGLGATGGIDYTREELAEAARRLCPDGFDLVLDTVGGETLLQSYGLLKRGGRLVSTVEEPDRDRAAEHGVSVEFVFAEPDAEQLADLARRFDQKRLRTHVQKIYPLADAAEAHRVIEQRHVRGKLVLNL